MTLKKSTRKKNSRARTKYLTPERLEFLANRNAPALQNPSAVKLRANLLKYAGEEVLLLVKPEEIDRLLVRGEFHSGKGAVPRKMKVNRCHFNAAKLFLTGKAPEVASGFALSEGL